MYQETVKRETRNKYTIEWNEENEQSPLRLKLITNNEKERTNNLQKWKKALELISNSKGVDYKKEHCTRFTISKEKAHKMTATVYTNGKIMIQGQQLGKWITKWMPEIMKEVEKTIEGDSSKDKKQL